MLDCDPSQRRISGPSFWERARNSAHRESFPGRITRGPQLIWSDRYALRVGLRGRRSDCDWSDSHRRPDRTLVRVFVLALAVVTAACGRRYSDPQLTFQAIEAELLH